MLKLYDVMQQIAFLKPNAISKNIFEILEIYNITYQTEI